MKERPLAIDLFTELCGQSADERPLAIDLFTGLHGWAEGLVAEGWRVIGFDLEDMCAQFNVPRPPYVQLVIQNVLTLHGSQFKDAALIVASPPCQEYSYMAMPWSRARAIAEEYRSGKRDVKKLTALFDACFRIQREACEAAGRHIPMVVENVRGAIPWVGRSRWNYGSFHLWGDVPALMPMTTKRRMKFPAHCGPRLWRDREVPRLDDGSISPEAHKMHMNLGTKNNGDSWLKAASGSNARKAASAMIAKIPEPLARHIAAVWRPR